MSSAKQIKAHMQQQELDLNITSLTDSPGQKKELKKLAPSKESVMESEEINGNLIRALEQPGNNACADCNRRGNGCLC